VIFICSFECAGQGKRGKTTLKGARAKPSYASGQKLSIEFELGSQKTYKPVGDNANTFASLVGTIVDRFPMTCKSWKNVPRENKDLIWPELEVKFLTIQFNVVNLLQYIH
jgi:hypothetical protein